MKNKAGTTIAVVTAAIFTVIGLAVAVYALTADESAGKSTGKHEAKSAHSHEHGHEHVGHDGNEQGSEAGEVAGPAEVIEYTNDGFAQTSYTVAAGDIVQVKNVSGSDMYFTTGDHHNHDIHSPLNLGVVKAGAAAEFAAPEAGVYQFHNHDNEAQAGELIVQ